MRDYSNEEIDAMGDEELVRAFAERFPTSDTQALVGLCAAGKMTWDQAGHMIARASEDAAAELAVDEEVEALGSFHYMFMGSTRVPCACPQGADHRHVSGFADRRGRAR